MNLNDCIDQLISHIRAYGRVAVAFSAGVDSTVVAQAACLACGNDAVAITAQSPSLAAGELKQATQLAQRIGIRHHVLRTAEFENERYLANPSNRCFFCKTELYEQMAELREDLQFDVILNGANSDDQGDHRPGMVAAADWQVRSPLLEIGLNKQQVRELAQYWNLPVWDKPATPCLSSRIAYGVSVSPERVERIDRAEQFLKNEFNLRELRVRLEANELARIEVPTDALSRLLENDNRQKITAKLHELGFKFVTLDLEGFRSGSMNAVLPAESLVNLSSNG